MPLETVVSKMKKISADKKSSSTKEQVQLIIPVITTPEITDAASSPGGVPQQRSQKRYRTPVPHVGEMKFANLQEAELFFRVGKNKDSVSPCVIVGNLDVQYPLVYEEWQKHRGGKNGVTHYRCRRQRGMRTKSKRSNVASSVRVRQPDKKVEYIGCDCPARYRLQVMEDGSVSVNFFGHHNHDVQKQYAVRFLNPITTCFRIREIVDSKLLAGVQKLHSILTGVLSEMFKYRQKRTKSDEEVLRCYHMAFALTRKQIQNRRDQLGLNVDQLAHKCVKGFPNGFPHMLRVSIYVSKWVSMICFHLGFHRGLGFPFGFPIRFPLRIVLGFRLGFHRVLRFPFGFPIGFPSRIVLGFHLGFLRGLRFPFGFPINK